MSKELHIGIVAEEYPPGPHGGAGSFYRDLCEGLVDAGHRATVICTHPWMPLEGIRDEMVLGVRVIRIPFLSARWPHRMKQFAERWRARHWLRRIHAKTPFSLVETSDYNGWFSSGAGIDAPSVVRIHGSTLLFDTELGRPAARFDVPHEIASLRGAGHLAAVSQYAAARTLELAGLSGRTCTVIPNGVDTTYFCPDPAIPVESGLVVYVNMLSRRKGIEDLIDAANETFPSRPHARLVAIGADKERCIDRPFLELLKERVRPELRSRIEFPGRLPREEVRHWLRRAQVCCYPSRVETFGIAPVEAMATGKPVIYSRCGPGPEVIDDGQSGLLCDPGKPGELTQALGNLLDDEGLCLRLGAAARAAAVARFDKGPWVQRNIEFFSMCCV